MSVPIRVTVRVLVALACVAGVAVSLIARDSRIKEQEAFAVYFEHRDRGAALELLREARTLNPRFSLAIAEARLRPDRGVAILREAVRNEPGNWELWMRLAQQQVRAGDRAAAARSWARARELAPLLPEEGPPPGI